MRASTNTSIAWAADRLVCAGLLPDIAKRWLADGHSVDGRHQQKCAEELPVLQLPRWSGHIKTWP